MQEVHEDGVSVDVWILGRVDSREILVLYEDGVVCMGQRRKGEGGLEVLTSRGMIIEVNGVGLEDVGVTAAVKTFLSSFRALNDAA